MNCVLALFVGLLFNCLSLSQVHAATKTPPMGINVCAAVGCSSLSTKYSESYILSVAHRAHELGLWLSGYRVLLLHHGWATQRDPTTHALVADPVRFPSGLASLCAKLAASPLFFTCGVAIDRGVTETMEDGSIIMGMQGYESIDVANFAAWGVNYFMITSQTQNALITDHQTAFQQYNALNKLFIASNPNAIVAVGGGFTYYASESVLQPMGNSWMVGSEPMTWNDAMINADLISHTYGYVGPQNGWSDFGSVKGSWSSIQQQSFVTLGALTSSPLFLGVDLFAVTAAELQAFTNPEVLNIHQDVAGIGSERMTGGPTASMVPPVWSVHQCDPNQLTQQWSLVPTSSSSSTFTIESNFLSGYCLASVALRGNGCSTLTNQQVLMIPCQALDDTQCVNNTLWTWKQPSSSANDDDDNEDENEKDIGVETGNYALLQNVGQLGFVPGAYATVDQTTCGNYKCHWSGVFLESEHPASSDANARQLWYWNSTSKLLYNEVGVSSNGTCLQATKATKTNIYGKSLSDGSFVMLMINNGPTTTNVTCDSVKCLGPVHFPLKLPVYVRDLFNHVDLGIMNVGPFVQQVPGNGGAALYRFSQTPY